MALSDPVTPTEPARAYPVVQTRDGNDFPVGYAMSFYKLGVQVGAGLALVIGGVLYDYFDALG